MLEALLNQSRLLSQLEEAREPDRFDLPEFFPKELETLYLFGMPQIFDLESVATLPQVVVIVEHLGQFLLDECYFAFFQRPNIDLKLYCDEGFADACAVEFPHYHVMVIPSIQQADTDVFKKFKFELLRRTEVMRGCHREDVHFPYILNNIVANTLKLPRAFLANRCLMQGVPAVVCGAGPSLSDSMGDLKRIRDRALVLGGGSTLQALVRGGVEPHVAAACDPHPWELDIVRSAGELEMPLLYTPRVEPRVLDLASGPLGYVQMLSGGSFEHWLEMELGLEGSYLMQEMNDEAMSVTTLCIAYAQHLGCNPIIFVGIDLAFSEGKRYSSEVDHGTCLNPEEIRAGEQLIEKGENQTLVKWVMESEWISNFAKHHKETTFINATQGGIGFDGISFQPLSEISLRSNGNIALNHTLLELDEMQIVQSLQKMQKSLQKCHDLYDARDRGVMGQAPLEISLSDEIGYIHLLKEKEWAISQNEICSYTEQLLNVMERYT